MLFNLIPLGRIRYLARTAHTSELGRAVAVADTLAANHVGQRSGLAAGLFIESLQFIR